MTNMNIYKPNFGEKNWCIFFICTKTFKITEVWKRTP